MSGGQDYEQMWCEKPHPTLPGVTCGRPHKHDRYKTPCGSWVVPEDKAIDPELEAAGHG